MAEKLNIKPLARVIDFQDAATEPIDFPIAPAFAIPSVIRIFILITYMTNILFVYHINVNCSLKFMILFFSCCKKQV